MKLHVDVFPTPFGPFSLAVNDEAVTAAAFGDLTVLSSRIHGTCNLSRDAAAAREAREQVLAYFARERRTFELRLQPLGTPFQCRVWQALQSIPLGETRSYAQLATQLGNPAASRAVGRANATNPICLIVPCHRVIGADGSLTGFAFGTEIKRRLLDHEGARPLSRAA